MSDETALPGSGEPTEPSRWAKPGCVTIRCRRDGPLVIEIPDGNAGLGVRVIDHEGGEFVSPSGKRGVALCRCGHSAAKPFCDGSHKAAGFTAENLAGK